MKLTDDQRAELRERILGVMPEHVDLGDVQSWWECGCNDDGHLNGDVRMTSLTGAWDHVVTDHLAPLIESWLYSPPEGWEERIDRLYYVNVQGVRMKLTSIDRED